MLSIIDTGGDLASTQTIIENYKKANPYKIKEIKLQRAPAPEVPAKIKAQQDAGRLDINLILTGQDGGSVLAANNQLIKLFPDYEKMFPRDELTDGRQGACRTKATATAAVGRQSRRAGADLQSEQGAEPAEDRRRTAGMGEGQSRQIHVCAAGQQRPRPFHRAGHGATSSAIRSRWIRKRAGTRPGLI